MNARPPSPWPWPRSLATVPAGEAVRVDSILFGTIQRKCEKAGIRVGETLSCRRIDGDRIFLELEDGRSVEISFSTAWFIEVVDLGGPSSSDVVQGRSGKARSRNGRPQNGRRTDANRRGVDGTGRGMERKGGVEGSE